MCDHHVVLKGNKKIIPWVSVGLGFLAILLLGNSAHLAAHYVIEGYMRVLRLLSLPILFFSILSTTSSLHASERWKGVFSKIVIMSLLTTFLAALVAALVFAWIAPVGAGMEGGASSAAVDPFLYLVPDNIVQMFLSFNVIAIVGLGLVLGYATQHIPEDERLLFERLTRAMFGIFVYLARTLIKVLPYILWAFVLTWYAMILEHMDSIMELGSYVCTVLVANSIQGILVIPVILKLFGLRPWEMFKHALPALSVAFISKSSAITLPVSMRVCTEKLNLPEDYTAMSLPLCTSVNMNGCAAFIYITVHFIAASQGIVWSLTDHFIWVLLSVVAAFGNAGVPMGCYFMASAFLVMLDLPTTWMQLILPFYLFLDMYETAINVWSDISVVSMVASGYNQVTQKGEH